MQVLTRQRIKSPKLEQYRENLRPKIAAVQPIGDFFTGPLGYILHHIGLLFFCSKQKTTVTSRNQMLHGMLLNTRYDSGLQSQDLVDFLLSSYLPNYITTDYA